MKHTIEIKVEQYYLLPILRALVHSIIFHRSFADITPVEVDLLNSTYCKCDYDVEMSTMIETKLKDFSKQFLNNFNKNQTLVYLAINTVLDVLFEI